jgi:nicotinamide phosphoribosyltransferase
MINPLNCIDFYKADHRRQYPDGTSLVVSNLTPRSGRYANVSDKTHIVFFGLQYFLKQFLTETWQLGFFGLPKEAVLAAYKRRMDTSLGPDSISCEHIAALHDLGYLPIEIRAVDEGSRVLIGVPCLTIHNTLPEFFWLTNYFETVLSAYLWLPCTSATTAYNYRRLIDRYSELTGSPAWFSDFQAHDFSFRGMGSLQSAMLSGAAHLACFKGTDTVAAIDLLEQYYGADADKEMVGGSVPATEHSVMCMGGDEDELGTFRRLIVATYPKGIVSIVSDTWDFWRVITEHAVTLHQEIMGRDGKVVFRPDSGDPVKILVGDPDAELGSPEFKGAVECLWEIFGGTETEAGYKLLDSHVGLIYGDSITYDRAERILQALAEKGFASANVVFGVGSYTYQFVTRDTWGWAVKATYGIVNGEGREIFKSPKTDDGIKKSARGLVLVNDQMKLVQGVEWADFTDDSKNRMRRVFYNGKIVVETTLNEIRERVKTA